MSERTCHPAETVSLGILSATSLGLALTASGWGAFILIGAFAVSANSFYEQLRVTKLDALYETLNLLSSLFAKTPVAEPSKSIQRQLARVIGKPVVYWQSQLPKSEVDLTTPDFWTKKRIASSKILCGIRGSGKSKLSEYIASMLIDGTDLLISDRHYDAEESQWLKGMERSDFEQQILLKTTAETYRALQRYRSVLADRIATSDRSATPIHIIIDEWGGCWRNWDEDVQADVISILEFINEEGRKYGVNYTIMVHQLTEKRTGLPEAVTTAADLYMLGDAISATTYTIPASFSAQRKDLMAQRKKTLGDVDIPQRVVVYRDAMSGDGQVVIMPDLENPPELEVKVMAGTLDAIYEPGMSARLMSELMGITNRKKSNPEYAAIVEFLEGKTTDENA